VSARCAVLQQNIALIAVAALKCIVLWLLNMGMRNGMPVPAASASIGPLLEEALPKDALAYDEPPSSC
jgi:hypothetical protein